MVISISLRLEGAEAKPDSLQLLSPERAEADHAHSAHAARLCSGTPLSCCLEIALTALNRSASSAIDTSEHM
jgi:hypothetical protein